LRSTDEAAYIPDDDDDGAAVRRTAERFVELRGDQFAGGLVARRFERFVGAEARTWWIDGGCVALSAHPDTPDRRPPHLASALSALDLGFFVADLVRDDAGDWRVVELVDGQVSGAPAGFDLTPVLRALVIGRRS
jgi:hypothetical protein